MSKRRAIPTLKLIFEETLKEVGVTLEEYNSIADTKKLQAITIRQLFCLIAQEWGYSQTKTGNFINIHHTTACHNKDVAQGYCSYDKEYRKKLKI